MIYIEEITQYYFTETCFSMRLLFHIDKYYNERIKKASYSENFVSKIENGFIFKDEDVSSATYYPSKQKTEISIKVLNQFFTLYKWDKEVQKIVPVYTNFGFRGLVNDIVDSNIHEFLHHTFLTEASEELNDETKNYKMNHAWIVQLITSIATGHISYDMEIRLEKKGGLLFIDSPVGLSIYFDTPYGSFYWPFNIVEAEKFLNFVLHSPSVDVDQYEWAFRELYIVLPV